MRKSAKPVFKAAALGLALTAALAGCFGGSSGSDSDGEAPTPSKEVTIKRDAYGVPHVFADSVYGLYYGYGYALATDRLYQMDIARRIGSGTVAEVLGAQYAAIDVSTLSNFDPDSIRRQMAGLSQEDRDIFEGYAQGFNARIKEVLADKKALLPKGYADNGFEPTLWQAEDVVMVWVGLILNRFFAGTAEVANLNLRTTLREAKGQDQGDEIFRQLRWLEDATAPTIVPRDETAVAASGVGSVDLADISPAAARAHHAQLAALMGEQAAASRPTASNAWVISPERSAEGAAMLYNGPQQGFYSPSFLYTVGLHGAGYNVTGSASVGLPAIFFGTNGDIAWGSTVGSLDTNDTYQEVLNPANQYEYMYEGAYRPMNKKTVSIRVKGEADTVIDVYSTVHGYVKSWDLQNGRAYTHKRSWEGVEVESLLGWTQAAKAGNWNEFLEQGARVGSSITWFYADRQGNIGSVGLGHLPDRPQQQDIQLPAVGDGSMEWRGLLPFSHNPRAYNPKQGYLASWNNQIAAELRADAANFSYVDRVNELLAVLENKESFSADDVWGLNRVGAFADINARYFADDLVQAGNTAGASPLAAQAAGLVAQWDYGARDDDGNGFYDAPGLTVYRAWLGKLFERVFADDLPAPVYQSHSGLGYPSPQSGSAAPGPAVKLLWNALSEQSGVPQTYDFLNGQDKQALMLQALEDAVGELAVQQGNDPQAWRTPVTGMVFGTSNAGVPWAVDSEAHAAPVYMNRGTKSYRVVMDQAGAEMCSVVAPGQSGFVAPDGTPDAHYEDQWEMYLNFECKPEALDGQVAGNELKLNY